MIIHFFCNLNFPKNFACPLGKLRTEFTCPIANPLAQAIRHDFIFNCMLRFVKHKISYLPDQSLKLRPGIRIQNTPDWSPYISFKNYSWGENLIKDQSISLFKIILLTLTTSTCDCVYLLLGENGCWSLLGFKGLILPHNCHIAM